ncbi:hypothetical protein SPRG_05136 [Saprolegnia parasitica CBS 223.65]|uniref:tRNA (guanosine(18)-2'-O)-methyltransferase TARBP1 n=1 Tax=Saprolegnia parasitica (strain CBS 223.65) TaxID=695850 RepID=A0A067CTS6_SAPPC|nr:hypothetical protein SPRG_05136 [Saprolegnia parasitica CBS 223.65]KDO29946.1 hypothetical protein SPRG_05136 [Saprolegnia parasitica CBS 223.65]|eukprot:XP_012199130.1 hypothetical protein SPRG_05136 [Saprolegnia parasitica CBS 223.65]
MDRNDMMVRKMALHLLHVSLANESPRVHASWTEFVQCFEVVHFHQEQHLLEQVWPRITALLASALVAAATTDDLLFAHPLPFEWFQSILNRCWQHDNPVVRRLTLVESMKAVVDADAFQGPLAPSAVEFLTKDLLLALNDPFLYKHDKYQVKATATTFLAALLTHATRTTQLSPLAYVTAVQSAIFGDDVRGNSPDALLAMLGAFQHLDSRLQMDAPTWSILRYMVQAHVLQSFPHSMKVLVPLLQHMLLALTPSLPLDVLLRVLALFPTTHLATHQAEFGAYLRPYAASIDAAFASYLAHDTAAPSPMYLARLYLITPLPLHWAATEKKDVLHLSELFRALHEVSPHGLVTESLLEAFPPGLAQLEEWLASSETHDVELSEQMSVVYLVAHLALHRMLESGNCDFALQLNDVLAAGLTCTSPRTQALGLSALELVASEGMLLDSMAVFDPMTLVPTLLRLTPARGSLVHVSVKAKFGILASVLETCWALETSLLRETLRVVLDGLSTAGSDPSILEAMARVLGRVLPYTVCTIGDTEERDLQIDLVFAQVWAAYMDSRKPDGLSYVIVQCLFQPRLVTLAEPSTTLKEWFHKWASWAETGKRPNVMYHLATTLCGIWRQYPQSAISYLDELVRLLLYKEPSVDEKERMIYLDDAAPLKTKFVRFVALAFVEDAPTECAPIMDALIEKLLSLQLTPAFAKPQMINSDGFGKQLRSWQALCILSRYLRADTIQAVHTHLWRGAFLNHNLPQIRYYVEIFCMRVCVLFPTSSFPYVHALLSDMHLMPQLSASTLLIAGSVLRWLPVESSPELHLKTLQLMAPWLNSAHGHTRTIVQFVMTSLLPYFLAHPTLAPQVSFLEATLRFLSTNKECKRMFRRQTAQMASFLPEKECVLEGLLDHPLNEFDEIVPISVLCQIKETLSAAYAQFLHEDKAHGGQYQTNVAEAKRLAMAPTTEASASDAASSGIVQRKIDPHATGFLEDMLAMYESENLREKQVNARRARRQSVIVCASLVDKLPNVAGLARTCEIFNASKLLIPNMAMTHDIVFRQISVTADKWVPMEEVKPDMVRTYCRRMQREGYTIVALEQTSSSESLTTYQFPDKVVIVLGNEKEGIPVEILDAVDHCVEIPQLGVIRSLNVHVSGAILLWGYTQQQLAKAFLECTGGDVDVLALTQKARSAASIASFSSNGATHWATWTSMLYASCARSSAAAAKKARQKLSMKI